MHAFEQANSDRSRVAVEQPWEVAHWCREFGCQESDLLEAVATVGAKPEDVRARIERSWW